MIWNVSRVVEKQLARVGLNSFDVVAGTGDGGGENEGSHGIHRHFEDLCPGYVRHRCLPHIAWRTADMAIKASNLEYKHLAAYLVDGTTWTRLREIACRGCWRRGPQSLSRRVKTLSEPLWQKSFCHRGHETPDRHELLDLASGKRAHLAHVGHQGPRATNGPGS